MTLNKFFYSAVYSQSIPLTEDQTPNRDIGRKENGKADSHLVYPKLTGSIFQGDWILLEYLGQPYSIIFSSPFALGFVVSPETQITHNSLCKRVPL